MTKLYDHLKVTLEVLEELINLHLILKLHKRLKFAYQECDDAVDIFAKKKR